MPRTLGDADRGVTSEDINKRALKRENMMNCFGLDDFNPLSQRDFQGKRKTENRGDEPFERFWW